MTAQNKTAPSAGPATAGPLKPTELPDFLSHLPRLGFITREARSRAESEQPDVLINVKSLDDLVVAARRHFTKDPSVG